MSDKPETQPAPAGPAEQQSSFSLPMPGPASRPTLLEIALLLGILLLAGALRVHRLGAKSLWLDEIFFASAARQGELLGPYGALTGTHAPLYLFLVRLASLVGESELVLRLPAAIASTLGVSEMALRLPAAIASILGVAALWALGRRMLGPTVGLLAAFFLALSAMHIEFAQEVHAYALLATLSTLLLWSLLRAAQREAGPAAGEQRRPAWRWLATWAPFILFALLGIYTHSYALVPVGLSLLFFPLLLADGRRIQPAAPGASSRRALLHLLIALAAVGIAALPLLMGQPATAGAGISLRLAAERGASLSALWLAFVSYRPTWLMDPLFFAAVTCWWLAGLIWLLWRRRPLGLALALWLLAPLPLIAWIASAAGLNLAPRRLLFLLPMFQLLVAVGVVTVARLAGRLAQGLAPRQPRHRHHPHSHQ
ncbi:MAG: glycosyltransferase family 39 protein, partial [Anaerolinea sp.]|nr:glycosyltransferase family 39 protein [Anaerolinea sp.]